MTAEKTRPAKFVHLIHLDGAGGGPRTASQHVAYYSNFFDITVIHGGRGYLTEICQKLKVPEIQLPIDRLSSLPIGAVKLWWELRKIRPDLLILHGQWAAPLGALVARLAGVRKTVYICHWPSFYTDWDLKRVIRNFLSEWIPCRYVSHVITISESNMQRYVQLGLTPPDRISMIPNPVPLRNTPIPEVGQKVREFNCWSPHHRHVVSVGRLTDQKRVDWLIDAWQIVSKQAPEARLWIIGDGPLEGQLKERAARLGLTETCTFLGAKPNAWSYIAAADIVAMTSLYEARGNVVTEAMACGKPIVANLVDGICDSYTDGVEGYLVPPANPNALAERLVELVRDPAKCQSMGDMGKETVRDFDQRTILPKYLATLLNVLQSGR
jgi:glycosyltransferase involved in cell wall biosynthesis